MRLLLAVVAVGVSVVLTGCSGSDSPGSEPTTVASVQDLAAVDRRLCADLVGSALSAHLTEYLSPTHDPRADDLAEALAFKYGPGSAHFVTLSRLMLSSTVKTAAQQRGVPATVEALRPEIEKGCSSATSTFVSQAAASADPSQSTPALPRSSTGADGVPGLPEEGEALPADLAGTSCREVLGYWAPLVAQDSANAGLIAARLYGGSGSYLVNEALLALGKNEAVESDPDAAVDAVCGSAAW